MVAAKTIITDRDEEIITDIYNYRTLSTRQIERLHFPSLQTAQRRLRILAAAGYIKKFEALNIDDDLYQISQSGINRIAANLKVSVNALKWPRASEPPKDYYFLNHLLAINDFRISLRLACLNDSSDIRLLGWIPEYFGEKRDKYGLVKYLKDSLYDDQQNLITHTPDALFALTNEEAAALFFLEIDRGTETISDESKGVLKCLKFYLYYLTNKQFQRYQEDFHRAFKFCRILFVTSSAARVNNIRGILGNYFFPRDKNIKSMIWLTDRTNISEDKLFKPIWLSGDINDSNLYSIG
jgi:hypothetical protein